MGTCSHTHHTPFVRVPIINPQGFLLIIFSLMIGDFNGGEMPPKFVTSRKTIKNRMYFGACTLIFLVIHDNL